MPSRGQLLSPPLYIIKLHDQVIFQDTIGAKLSEINPQNINAINVFKGTSAIDKYGAIAKNGVVEIILKEEKYPPGTSVFKTDSTKVKLKEKLK